MVEYAYSDGDGEGSNNGWDGFDCEMEDLTDPLQLGRVASEFKDGPRLTRGFSFNIIP
jgi:hypothetical protein